MPPWKIPIMPGFLQQELAWGVILWLRPKPRPLLRFAPVSIITNPLSGIGSMTWPILSILTTAFMSKRALVVKPVMGGWIKCRLSQRRKRSIWLGVWSAIGLQNALSGLVRRSSAWAGNLPPIRRPWD